MRRLPGCSLWLGHAGDARDVPALRAAGIEAVVELAIDEAPAALPRDLARGRFPLVDGAGNPPWLLRAAVDMVALSLRANVPTLVCCGAGMSRTPAVAGAAIAMVLGCSPDEALAIAVEGGPADVSPNLWRDLSVLLDGGTGDVPDSGLGP
ncbi:hypothetical protein OJF2_45360 [Aquisphaera giovannonii]|uniref:Dual specificity phosphatase, catalytic domain n=1 Tax=Aquisphaera giovannonii TaxID=406548 RepID=A0A5B9W620_9BACT|nr:dual specificity protein phosphatase family protein [Aquisphaera giovannonii]QEH35978.1 hypothetical protein OJF2_45360 [Aquisphaera giovannonii]